MKDVPPNITSVLQAYHFPRVVKIQPTIFQFLELWLEQRTTFIFFYFFIFFIYEKEELTVC